VFGRQQPLAKQCFALRENGQSGHGHPYHPLDKLPHLIFNRAAAVMNGFGTGFQTAAEGVWKRAFSFHGRDGFVSTQPPIAASPRPALPRASLFAPAGSAAIPAASLSLPAVSLFLPRVSLFGVGGATLCLKSSLSDAKGASPAGKSDSPVATMSPPATKSAPLFKRVASLPANSEPLGRKSDGFGAANSAYFTENEGFAAKNTYSNPFNV
jgi:hypothetical protein